jgi:transposase InsO family protein
MIPMKAVAERNARRQAWPDASGVARRSRRAAGVERQRSRRERESEARRRAAAFGDCVRAQGRSWRYAASKLGVPPRTLTHWRRRERPDVRYRPRGRRRKESALGARLNVVQLMCETGPHVGLPTLRAAFPEMPRSELIELQRDYRREFQRGNQLLIEELSWSLPGRVWAMDHAAAPSPIDGVYGSLLAVRDLASGMQLGWLPVPDETAETTMDALAALFVEYGPPLVLKSDNGSGFKSERLMAFLDQWGVTPLHSPPVTPEYNGSCEAGIGAMKVRTHYQAALAGRPGRWTSEDVEAARRRANEFHHPDGHTQPTPLEVWQSRSLIDDNERKRFLETLERIRREHEPPRDAAPTEADLAREQRSVVRQALVELGVLSTRRRLITLPIKSKKPAKIS